MAIFREMQCCGIKELAGISSGSPADMLFQALTLQNPYAAIPDVPRTRFLIFSQAHDTVKVVNDVATVVAEDNPDGYGYRFAQFIRDNNLGEVHADIGGAVNPNSGRFLKMWVWNLDMAAVQEWLVNEIKRRDYKPKTIQPQGGIMLSEPAVLRQAPQEGLINRVYQGLRRGVDNG